MAKSRKVSSISKEFDGKEVQGKLIERSGLLGSKVKKEVFKFPGGGKHVEKTRTNKNGNVISRSSKDTKVNPFKFFNDNKAMAYKKAGGEMSKYKKSLKRFQGDVTGSQVGPMTQEQAANAAFASPQNDPAIPPIPYANPTPVMNSSRPIGINPIDAMGTNTERMSNIDKGQYNSGAMEARSRRVNSNPYEQKKGGSVRRKK